MSSDVCSSDLIKDGRGSNRSTTDGDKLTQIASLENLAELSVLVNPETRHTRGWSNRDMMSVVYGKGVSVRVDFGCRCNINKKTSTNLSTIEVLICPLVITTDYDICNNS